MPRALPSPNLLSRVWLWPNLLSLDAPVVALLWQILFLRCFHAESGTMPALLLTITVWLIYTADRALDAWRGSSSLPRHEFYRRHWRALLPVWIAALALAASLAWTGLPRDLFYRGCALAAAVALYFAAVHLRSGTRWPKEVAVAIVFALGASLVVWTSVRTAADVVAIALFSSLCWINCVAIDRWESGMEEWPIAQAAIAIALASILLLFFKRPIIGEAEAASAFGFILLDRARRRFSRDALRVLADVALLSPLLFLPVAGA